MRQCHTAEGGEGDCGAVAPLSLSDQTTHTDSMSDQTIDTDAMSDQTIDTDSLSDQTIDTD